MKHIEPDGVVMALEVGGLARVAGPLQLGLLEGALLRLPKTK
jgi:hypothetical protein